MDKIETINFHEEKEVEGIKFWCYNAGHVLGAAMFMLEIAGVKVSEETIKFPNPSKPVIGQISLNCEVAVIPKQCWDFGLIFQKRSEIWTFPQN